MENHSFLVHNIFVGSLLPFFRHDLSTAELERGRLLLADGELSCLERQREKNKQYSAAKRVQRERSIANSLKMKESR